MKLLPLALSLCLAGLALPHLGRSEAPAAESSPKVWIFTGVPGDEEHHALFERTLGRMRQALEHRFGIPSESLTILYGPESAGYDGICTRERLLDGIDKAVAAANSGSPVWIVFIGHSNPTASGANFNLPGPDVSARDLRDVFAKTHPEAKIAVLFTTSSSGKFLPWISGPGRLVLTATLFDQEDNETEFPHVLADVLGSMDDPDGDGRLSLLEIFNACNAGVKAVYDSGGFVQRERAMLDGNGDRRGTQRPADEDAEPAREIFFPIVDSQRRFD